MAKQWYVVHTYSGFEKHVKTLLENKVQTHGLEEEIGDLMFSVINLSRKYKVDPEQALLSATNKFEARFRLMEKEAAENNKDFSDYSPKEMEIMWERAKDKLKNLK